MSIDSRTKRVNKILTKDAKNRLISSGTGKIIGACASGTVSGAIVAAFPPAGKLMTGIAFVGSVAIGTIVGLEVDKRVENGMYDLLTSIDNIRNMVKENVDVEEEEC